VRTRWPWITTVAAVILAINLIGLDILYSAFLSGERLSRNIWGPIVWVLALVLAALGFLEHLMWKWIGRKPNFLPGPPIPTSEAGGPNESKTET
jgi:hypothetical protein